MSLEEAVCPFPCRPVANADPDGDASIIEAFLDNLQAGAVVQSTTSHAPVVNATILATCADEEPVVADDNLLQYLPSCLHQTLMSSISQPHLNGGWRNLYARSDQQPLPKLTGAAPSQSSLISHSSPASSNTSTMYSVAPPVRHRSHHHRHHLERRRLNGCTDRDISISQSRDLLTGGVPQYVVQIYNTCMMGGCTPSEVHVKCGWFASKVVVNPGIFRRLAYDDCLVNAGGPILRGQILRFTYQNSFMYPLAFKSAQLC
ncbi:hypothetical protein L7F22_053109 [Adiantum nelumboides]|nr:hypothetical protein [Adiantum nelumboides]